MRLENKRIDIECNKIYCFANSTIKENPVKVEDVFEYVTNVIDLPLNSDRRKRCCEIV